MERAARHPVRALLLELHVVLYDPNDVCLSFQIVDECLGVTHLFKSEPRIALIIVSTQPVLHQHRPGRVGRAGNEKHEGGRPVTRRSLDVTRPCRGRE